MALTGGVTPKQWLMDHTPDELDDGGEMDALYSLAYHQLINVEERAEVQAAWKRWWRGQGRAEPPS